MSDIQVFTAADDMHPAQAFRIAVMRAEHAQGRIDLHFRGVVVHVEDYHSESHVEKAFNAKVKEKSVAETGLTALTGAKLDAALSHANDMAAVFEWMRDYATFAKTIGGDMHAKHVISRLEDAGFRAADSGIQDKSTAENYGRRTIGILMSGVKACDMPAPDTIEKWKKHYESFKGTVPSIKAAKPVA